jgi:hypothetical protein
MAITNKVAKVILTPKAYQSRRLSGFPVSLNKNTKPLIKLSMTQINNRTMTTLSNGLYSISVHDQYISAL